MTGHLSREHFGKRGGNMGGIILVWPPPGSCWVGSSSARVAGVARLVSVAGVTWWAYALTQFQAITHYLWLSVWPQNLTFHLWHGTLAKPGIEIVPYVLLVVLLATGTLIALRRSPGIGFLGAWFFLVLAPSSSVVPVATETMAEHRMYLALAPVVVLAVLGLYRLVGKGSVVVFLALMMGLAWLTFHRNETYRSALAIWSDTVAKNPNDAGIHNEPWPRFSFKADK
jgi:hypothetical protein